MCVRAWLWMGGVEIGGGGDLVVCMCDALGGRRDEQKWTPFQTPQASQLVPRSRIAVATPTTGPSVFFTHHPSLTHCSHVNTSLPHSPPVTPSHTHLRSRRRWPPRRPGSCWSRTAAGWPGALGAPWRASSSSLSADPAPPVRQRAPPPRQRNARHHPGHQLRKGNRKKGDVACCESPFSS